jgi:hypothetical protein
LGTTNPQGLSRIAKSAMVFNGVRVAQSNENKTKQRSGYDKGKFWHNLRNCLYRYNIKHNHWKVRKINFWMISLCPLLPRNVNEGGINKLLEIQICVDVKIQPLIAIT